MVKFTSRSMKRSFCRPALLLLFFALYLHVSCGTILAQSSFRTLERELDISKFPRADHLQLEVQPQARCFFGDLDVVYRDSKRLSPSGRIILTLEAISPSAGPAIALAEFFSSKGVDYRARLRIPNDLPGSAYGIFLCSDVEGTASNCQSAKPKRSQWQETQEIASRPIPRTVMRNWNY